MPDLSFERQGSSWYVRSAEWSSVLLIGRAGYVGTDRVLVTATLAREDRHPPLAILTERLNLLTHVQVSRFAAEAAKRMNDSAEGSAAKFQRAVESMLDALQEYLLSAQGDLVDLAADEIRVDPNLAPAYAVWPFVPVARAGLLIGPRGHGKSTMVQAAGLSVVTGKPVLPRCEPRIQGPVIYVGQEEDPDQWAKRLEMICRGLGIPRPHDYRYVALPDSSLISAADPLAELAARRKAALVIIDSAQATWGDGTDAGVREYATRWFHAVRRIGVPTWVIDHPNRADTKGGADLEAAGTSVKGDRAGHQWTLQSVELPPLPTGDARFHVTLRDTKRSYVARQPDITYAVTFHGYEWVHFDEADELTPETVVVSTRLFRDIAAAMRQDPRPDGWTLAELRERLGRSPDDTHLAKEVRSGSTWRTSPDGQFEERIVAVVHAGPGGRGRASRYALETRRPGLVFGSAPGGDDEVWQ